MIQINYVNIYTLNNCLLYEAEKKMFSYIFCKTGKTINAVAAAY